MQCEPSQKNSFDHVKLKLIKYSTANFAKNTPFLNPCARMTEAKNSTFLPVSHLQADVTSAMCVCVLDITLSMI